MDECEKVSEYLEDAMSNTNELKSEITALQKSLREKDELITCIREASETDSAINHSSDSLTDVVSTDTALANKRELKQRMKEMNELREIIRERDDQLTEALSRIREFEENNRKESPSTGQQPKELQKTIVRLTSRIQDLEKNTEEQTKIEIRSLKAELDETKQQLRNQLIKYADLKKTFEKEIKSSSDQGYASLSNGFSSDGNPFTDESDSEQSQDDAGDRSENMDVNFK